MAKGKSRSVTTCLAHLCPLPFDPDLAREASVGAPGRTRTCDLRIRSPALYPTELRAQQAFIISSALDCAARRPRRRATLMIASPLREPSLDAVRLARAGCFAARARRQPHAAAAARRRIRTSRRPSRSRSSSPPRGPSSSWSTRRPPSALITTADDPELAGHQHRRPAARGAGHQRHPGVGARRQHHHPRRHLHAGHLAARAGGRPQRLPRLLRHGDVGPRARPIPTRSSRSRSIRGPASAVWGANAMTGVVNVITKTPRELAAEGGTTR